MGKSSSAPTAPDPYQSAAAQYTYGTQAADYNAALNRVNQSGPTGSSTYSITGKDPQTGAPIYSQQTTLSPAQQYLLDASQGLQAGQLNAGKQILGQYDQAAAKGMPNLPAPVYAPSGYGKVQGAVNTSGVPGIGNVDSYYQQGQSKALAGEQAALDPYWNAQVSQLDSSLRNSGAHPGDPGYERAMSQLQAQRAGAYTQAAGQAVGVGNQLQQTAYGEAANTNQQLFGQQLQQMVAANQAQGQTYQQALQNAQQTMAARGQVLNQTQQQRAIPLNELQALQNNAQVSIPGAQAPPTSTAGTPDIMSAMQNSYLGQMAGYNANTGTNNALMGALGSLGSAAIMAYSDENLKKDFEHVGYTEHYHLPEYLFRYKGEADDSPKHFGVMAQDVEQVDPSAVHHDQYGNKMVDYSKVA